MKKVLIVFIALITTGFTFPADSSETNPGLVSTVASGVRGSLDSAGAAANIGLDYVSNGADYGLSFASNVVSGSIGFGKLLTTSFFDITHALIRAGINFTNDALEITDKVADEIPLVGAVIKTGTSLGKQGASLIEATAQTGIDTLKSIGNAAPNGLNSILQSGTDITKRVVNSGIALGKSGIDSGVKAGHFVVGTGEDIVSGAVNAVSNIQSSLPILGFGSPSSDDPAPNSTS